MTVKFGGIILIGITIFPHCKITEFRSVWLGIPYQLLLPSQGQGENNTLRGNFGGEQADGHEAIITFMICTDETGSVLLYEKITPMLLKARALGLCRKWAVIGYGVTSTAANNLSLRWISSMPLIFIDALNVSPSTNFTRISLPYCTHSFPACAAYSQIWMRPPATS